MQRRSKLSKKRQALVIEYLGLAKMLAKFFVQNRPHWQRAALIPDLEAEGFLALTKAARTYDPKRLPYPKAYFARACLNAMYKAIKKLTRQPGEFRITLEDAAQLLPLFESPDYLRMAIQDLGDDQDLAADRFQNGLTLRSLSEAHDLSLRTASVRSRDLAKRLAESLDIRLSPRAPDSRHRKANKDAQKPASRRHGKDPK